MDIREVKCKSCMTKSKLTDYVINPYSGCQHGCRYCYAVFMKRFQNIKEPWGEFIHIKSNCLELLEKELKKNKPGHIWLSSVTDPYTSIEGKTQLTRKILQTIAKSPYRNKFTIEILTKSTLVRRDFDIIKELNAELGLSINCLDGATSKLIEPLASPPKERIKILKEAKEKGIKVFGFISPVLPGITNLEELFKELQFCSYVWVELLNTKPSTMSRLRPVIKQHFPDIIPLFGEQIKEPEKYYQTLNKEVKRLEAKYNLKVRQVIKHS